MANQATPLAIRMVSHVQLIFAQHLLKYDTVSFTCHTLLSFQLMSRDKGVLRLVMKCNIQFINHLACVKQMLYKWAFSEVWKICCQVWEAFFSLRSVWEVVIIACWVWISQRNMKSTKPTLSHYGRSSLSVSALVLGSLGCSGFSEKLFHQTWVSSTGSLTVWLLQSCPATLQKAHSLPLWGALKKSMAWAPLLLIHLVRSHTWLSKSKLNHT